MQVSLTIRTLDLRTLYSRQRSVAFDMHHVNLVSRHYALEAKYINVFCEC